MTTSKPRDVDAYIAAAPERVRPLLEEIRRIIRKAAPKAVEKISYGIPFYEYHGRLIYFAAWKDHIAIYPLGEAAITLAEELEGYRAAKSTARLPLNKPLPVGLVEKLVESRIKEQEAAARLA